MLSNTHFELNTKATSLGLILVIALLVVVAYPGLGGPLVLDSVKLSNLDSVVQEHGQWSFWHTPLFGERLPGRFFSMLTFVINTQITDGVDPSSLKATNLFIHATCGILVFIFVRMLLASSHNFNEHRNAIALGTAALWLLSPVNISTSLYTIQRMAQLSTLFTLIGLIAYLNFRIGPFSTGKALRSGLIYILAFCLGMLSKENTILLPLFTLLIEVSCFRVKSVNSNTRKHSFALVSIVLLCGVLVFVTGVLLIRELNVFDYSQRHFTLEERLLTQPRVIWLYLQQLTLPTGGDIGLHYDGLAVSRDLFTPYSTLWSLVALLLLLILTIVLHITNMPLLGFGLGFFFVGHTLESTVIPLELAYPHRNYLPSVGVYFCIALLLISLLSRYLRSILVGAIFTAHILFFLYVGHIKSLTWSSETHIRLTAYRHHPESPRALTNYVELLFRAGRFDVALGILEPEIEQNRQNNTIPIIQFLFIKCHLNSSIPTDTYQKLATSQTTSPNIEISQALQNLTRLQSITNCDALNSMALVSALEKLGNRHQQQRGDAWHINYYMVELSENFKNRSEVNTKLQRWLDEGEIRAGFLLAHRLIEDKDKEAAASLLDTIAEKFPTSVLDSYRDDYRELKRASSH